MDGVSFDRPAFVEMMDGVKDGFVKTIIVKDRSRLGRNRLIAGALLEEDFVQYGIRYMAKAKKELAVKRKELEKSNRRISELDGLFKRLYEDHVGGRLSDDRFEKLSADYEAEQRQLTERVATLETGLAEQGEKAANVGKFLAIVRKYTEVVCCKGYFQEVPTITAATGSFAVHSSVCRIGGIIPATSF